MSVTVARAEPSIAGVGDYIELMKPRVMSLVVFTALVGLVRAPVPMHPVLVLTALLCIAVGAGAAGALNMWYDADIDARMAARPIPAGRLARGEALAFCRSLPGPPKRDAGFCVTRWCWHRSAWRRGCSAMLECCTESPPCWRAAR
jgi:hypothetical protein